VPKNSPATGKIVFNIDIFKEFCEEEFAKGSNADLAALSYMLYDETGKSGNDFSVEKISYEMNFSEGMTGTVTVAVAISERKRRGTAI
jgi:hypothetical protein